MKYSTAIFAFGWLLLSWTPYRSTADTRAFPRETYSYGGGVNEENSIQESEIGRPSDSISSSDKKNIFVLHDSSGIDKEFQMELLKSVFVSFRELDKDDLNPQFIDVSKVRNPTDETTTEITNLAIVAEWIVKNRTSSVVSLINGGNMMQFAQFYDQLARSISMDFPPEINIITPRSIDSNLEYPPSVKILTLQMNDRALSIALLNRVEKVGIRTLIPVLDSNTPSQISLLNHFIASGQERLKSIQLTRPIFINDPAHLASFREILDQYTGFSREKLNQHHDDGESKALNSAASIGVMMIASNGSQMAMKIAAEKKHMQIGWFSPNILQHEEWAYRAFEEENSTTTMKDTEKVETTVVTEQESNNVLSRNGAEDRSSIDKNTTEFTNRTEISTQFGLYSVSYVGSFGWDNPSRRRILMELTSFTGASPRILSAVLAYDSAWVAVKSARNQLHFPMSGLSGEIAFDSNGFRRDGVFFGVSAVPELSSPTVTLLQPSTWILEDTISIMETLEGQFLIKDYEVATSSILTGDELRSLANKTKDNEIGCIDHIMNVITHDPFNQMPYNYYFKEDNLPESLLIPNQHGFGINVLCIHDKESLANNSVPNGSGAFPEDDSSEQILDNESLTTTLQIACTPGMKISEPIKCFRSHFKQRQRRSPVDKVPEVQYQYGFGSGDIWNNQPQNTRWSNPKDESTNNYYYQYPQYSQGPTTPSSLLYRRQDVSAAAADVSTPAPVPAPTSKLPELRQILKAAKPFVGACIGSTTGCAMCVLVLGRLPLGAVPAACTGPCFVGTFGSCGGLLGRVFSETTVICTELFKQGLIDTETFVADAEFGRMMHQQFPTTLEGYQLLAKPIVEIMKSSAFVTNMVATFALPWAQHMKFLMGRSNEPNMPGLIIHTVGFPICNIVGQIYSFYVENLSFMNIICLILTTLSILVFSISSKSRHDNTKRNAREGTIFMHLLTILGRSQKLIRHVFI